MLRLAYVCLVDLLFTILYMKYLAYIFPKKTVSHVCLNRQKAGQVKGRMSAMLPFFVSVVQVARC